MNKKNAKKKIKKLISINFKLDLPVTIGTGHERIVKTLYPKRWQKRSIYDWYDSQDSRLTNGLTGKSPLLVRIHDLDGYRSMGREARLA